MTAKRLFGVVKGHREHIVDHTGRLYSDSEVADLLNTVCEDCNMYREDALKAEKDKEHLLEENNEIKHYKEAYATEIVKIKQTIKDMMENERTELGRSVLKQLWEAIQ